jgi:hypothetical protein
MSKRIAVSAFAILLAAAFTVAAQGSKDGSWTGWISDSHCKEKGENPKHADCAKKCVSGMNASYVLYVPASKKVFELDAQDKAAEHAGHHVKVTGTAEGDRIKVKSIEPSGEQKGQDKKG